MVLLSFGLQVGPPLTEPDAILDTDHISFLSSSTAEGNPHNPASKTPAAQVADNPTSSRAPSSVLPPSTPTASSIALIRQNTAAKSPEKAHDRYTALNAILKRSCELT